VIYGLIDFVLFCGDKPRGARRRRVLGGQAVADIVLINPRFEASMYGLEYAMPFLRAKAASPIASLPLLAVLSPAEHSVTLIDENVEPIDFARCAPAYIVGVTGMIVQRTRMLSIIDELNRLGVLVVVGGPLATAREELFTGRADVLFTGEAEETWPRFLAEWQEGRHQARYEQSAKTDMSSVPVPRYDLLKMRRYAFGTVQFSRGCPFTCEFCDIIVVFGRRPRFKTKRQVIAELDALLRHGVEHAFLVDDNLVGNKKAIKELLKAVIEWQEAHSYPMSFLARSLARPGGRRRVDADDGGGQHRRRLCRHREPQRGIPA